MQNDDFYNDDCEWYVEVGYCCPGQPLDSEFEGLLELLADSPLIGARFHDGRRYVTYHLGDNANAESFAQSAARHRDGIVTRLIPRPEDES